MRSESQEVITLRREVQISRWAVGDDANEVPPSVSWFPPEEQPLGRCGQGHSVAEQDLPGPSRDRPFHGLLLPFVCREPLAS